MDKPGTLVVGTALISVVIATWIDKVVIDDERVYFLRQYKLFYDEPIVCTVLQEDSK